MVLRLALAKARAVAADHPGATVVGADTVVVLDGEILGKPTDAADAADMLTRLSGRTHEVLTGVAVVPGECFATTTSVTFRTLTPAEVDGYVATGEPLDKAGAYGIQGLGGALVASISGSFDNVVGLPVEQLSDLLRPGGRRRQ